MSCEVTAYIPYNKIIKCELNTFLHYMANHKNAYIHVNTCTILIHSIKWLMRIKEFILIITYFLNMKL